MKKNLPFKVLFAIIFIISAISCSKPKYELKLNLQKGQNYLMSSQTDMKMTQKFMGMSIDMLMKMDMDLDFSILDIDKDSIYLLKVTYESLSYKMKSQGQNIEFGTDSNIKDTLFNNVFKNLKGKSFNMKFSKSGKIIEIKGIDSLIQTIYGNNILDSSKFKQFKEIFSKNFGEESIKNNFGSYFGYFPEKPVAIEEKWNNKNTFNSFFALTIENNYVLVDNKDNLYNIDIQSNMKTDAKNANIIMKGMEMKFDMKGTQKGYIKVDQKTGWIVESEVKQSISGNATMSSKGMPGGGNFAIPYSMESTTKIISKK